MVLAQGSCEIAVRVICSHLRPGLTPGCWRRPQFLPRQGSPLASQSQQFKREGATSDGPFVMGITKVGPTLKETSIQRVLSQSHRRYVLGVGML